MKLSGIKTGVYTVYGKIPVGSEENTRKNLHLVVRMMEYRLQSMEKLEHEIKAESERLHRRRGPKKIRASYRRLQKMMETVGELSIKDHFDAFHFQMLIECTKDQGLVEMPHGQWEPGCPRYIQ